MHREGHIGIGLLLYTPLAYYFTTTEQMTLMGVGLIAVTVHSYAPDFDLWLPGVSHRGLTHTFLGGLVAAVMTVGIVLGAIAGDFTGLTPSLSGYVTIAAYTFGISYLGFLSHLAGDVLTPMGITPFSPWSDHTYSLNVVNANNEWANERLAVMGAVAVTVAIVIGTVGLDAFQPIFDLI